MYRPRGPLIACWCKCHSGCSNSSRVSFSGAATRPGFGRSASTSVTHWRWMAGPVGGLPLGMRGNWEGPSLAISCSSNSQLVRPPSPSRRGRRACSGSSLGNAGEPSNDDADAPGDTEAVGGDSSIMVYGGASQVCAYASTHCHARSAPFRPVRPGRPRGRPKTRRPETLPLQHVLAVHVPIPGDLLRDRELEGREQIRVFWSESCSGFAALSAAQHVERKYRMGNRELFDRGEAGFAGKLADLRFTHQRAEPRPIRGERDVQAVLSTL